ncbi:MAG TPA: GNAT family N-acetyltransferase [Prolixibacteraceae bacterium]|nr:GNAT family N-acetyltransferase [Prolixibacteraceae bacterium]
MRVVELLKSAHPKENFSCGVALLDNYLWHQAGQDVRRKLTACFVLTESETGLIEGYYTLSNSSIPLNMVPDGFRKHLPQSYSSIPVTLIGRLAVDKRFHGKGTGEYLLIDALKKSFDLSRTIGSFAVAVDPINEQKVGFYLKYGFVSLPDSHKLFLPMKTIGQIFDSTNKK